jgi:hypothetical protein
MSHSPVMHKSYFQKAVLQKGAKFKIMLLGEINEEITMQLYIFKDQYIYSISSTL